MMEPREETPVNVKLVVISIVVAIVASGIVIWTIILNQERTTAETAKNSSSITAVKKAASRALTVADSQRLTLIAVCARFNTDEQISEDQTVALIRVENKYATENASAQEREYHSQRAHVLQHTENIRKQHIKTDCPKLMQKRIDAVPPLAPLTAPT